jgi:cellulose synthase operon protein C
MRRLLILAALALAAPLAAMPEAAGESLARAKAALQRGDGIAAEADLARAIAAGAERAEVAAAMGEAQLIQGQLGKAREWLAEGEFVQNEAAHGWRMLGLLERREGNLAAAAQAYEQALELAPDDPQLWVDIGRLRYVAGEHLPAIEAADRALAAGPDHPRALEFRAELARDAEGWAAALPLYQQALAVSPEDLALLGGYAATLGEAGRPREMLAVTRRMLAISPRHPAPWLLQAVLAARAGDIDLARSMLGRAGQIEKTPASLLLTGALELEAGNAILAIEPLVRLAAIQPGNQRAQLLLARALFEAGEYDVLFARFGPIAARGDASPYLLTVLARAHEERGDRIAAAGLLDRAAAAAPLPIAGIPQAAVRGDLAEAWSANPGSLATTVPYVRSLLSRGEVSPADLAAARFLELRPGSLDALALAGDLDLVQGRNDAAIERYLLSAKVRFPDLLLLRLCEAYARAGRANEGRALTGRYLAAYPGSLLAARLAADYSAHAGDWPRARVLLESVARRGANRDARLLADLAFAQLRSGDPAAARASAERAWRLQPQNATMAQAWALALVELGEDAPLARQLLDQARALGGDNPMLAEARRKL